MKNTTASQMAGVVAAGVVAYLVVSRTIKAGGKVLEGAKEVLTKDLNPASSENIVYKGVNAITGGSNSGPDAKPLGARIWEALNPGAVAAENALTQGTGHVSNTKQQAAVLAAGYANGGPSTGVYALPAPDESEAEAARLRRGEAKATAPQYAQNLIDMHYYGDLYGLNGQKNPLIIQ